MKNPKNTLVLSASLCAVAACILVPRLSQAQDAPQDGNPELDQIVVSGVRASLDRAIDIKRNSAGVVDAISAEDIGKFPDTNLAESLQRITGVSIDRQNGEGAEVTVRGFGPGFNLVTLNGRQLPTANVTVVGTDNGDFATGTSRSFDFSNLASESVSRLEVYKTGRAAVPTGGIGAAINIVTRKPLDTKDFEGAISAKGLYDGTRDGFTVTPEFSGFASWADDDQRFGIAVFGAYQKRKFSSRGAVSNDWNIERGASFLDPANGRVNANTQIENPPAADQLVSFPNDSRYFFSEGERQRINGQLVVQFEPVDGLRFTADALYAQNRISEQRSEQTNWFNRPFAQVRFDGNEPVSTAVFLQENINGVKDEGFEQQYRATKDRLKSFGANVAWDITDRLKFTLDGHHSVAESLPDNPNGATSTLVTIGAPIVAAQSVDYSNGFPVQDITINDALRGNGNGVVDIEDLGTQVARQNTSSQRQRVYEIRGELGWELDDDGSRFDAGTEYRNVEMRQRRTQLQQTLGDWGITRPGDVAQSAPGVLEEYCLVCKFQQFSPGRSEALDVAFRGNAVDLFNALSPVYLARGNTIGTTAQDDNTVTEKIWSVYGQLTWKGQIASRDAALVTGLRYEKTDTTSSTVQAIPTSIDWVSDNDFSVRVGNGQEQISFKGGYENLLPSIDFQIEARDDLVVRASYSKTIARSNYGNLFSATSVGSPPRPTAFGGIASASRGNANLLPLESDNIDVSVEWYFAPSSYLSVGWFDKRVRNFVGIGQTSESLFGLRDPSSGAPGSRSGAAATALSSIGAGPSDVNLFTMTALIQQLGSVAAATQLFQANFSNGALSQTFVDQVLAQVDVVPDANDPLFQFGLQSPINNRSANIYGFEFAGSYFFGKTGFGISAAYTLVRGDIGFNNGADPGTDQFALVGLSDTANVSLIYEKYGVSARVTYNWRDGFLTNTNRGGFRNPVYVDEYGQLDLNVSYDITDNLAVSFEAINLTQETQRTFGRDTTNLWLAQEQDPRYLLGVRYKF